MVLLPTTQYSRYLKFKFLSHYGDDFYCTVSQVKVHGSTMIESFQHEWQQSSAEVREVQDYMKKKDPKPSVTATATAVGGGVDSPTIASGGVPSQAGGGGSGGTRGSENANNVGQTTSPGGAPPSAGARMAPVNDGTFEHRPHAASAASVATGGSAASGAGAGTATVEDIVRGVPAEMVLPAATATCVGPTGRDGSCRGEMLADKVAATEGGAAGSAASLGAEIPTMGGAHAVGNINGGKNFEAGSERIGTATAGKVGGGIGSGGTARGHTDDVVRPVREGEGAVGAGNGGITQPAIGQQAPAASRESGQTQFQDSGAIDGSVGGAAATASSEAAGVTGSASAAGDGGVVKEGAAGIAVGEGRDVQTGGGGEEPPPPRKGIISSTMEAISKVVSRGEEIQPPDNVQAGGDATSGEAVVGADGASGTAALLSGGSVAGEAKAGDGDLGPRPPRPSGDGASSVQEGEFDAPKGDDAALAGAAAPGASVESEPPTVEERDSIHTAVERQRLSDATSSGDGAVRGGGGPPIGRLVEEAHELGGLSDQAGASADASGETVVKRQPTGHGESGVSSSSANEPSVLKVEPVGPGTRAGGSSNREQQKTEGSAAAVEPVVEEHFPAPAGISSSPQSAGASTGGKEERTDSPSTTATGVGAGTGTGGANHAPAQTAPPQVMGDGSLPQQGSGRLPPTAQTRDDHVRATGQAGESLNVVPPSPPVELIEETNAATLTAACLNSLSFSEFRDEVLARTQQAQQSAGGGVAIGGQYESIFKTLMNKIKTLEINQSLYSLYLGMYVMILSCEGLHRSSATTRISAVVGPCGSLCLLERRRACLLRQNRQYNMEQSSDLSYLAINVSSRDPFTHTCSSCPPPPRPHTLYRQMTCTVVITM